MKDACNFFKMCTEERDTGRNTPGDPFFYIDKLPLWNRLYWSYNIKNMTYMETKAKILQVNPKSH